MTDEATRNNGGASGLNAVVSQDVLEAENRACAKHNAALIEENVKLRRALKDAADSLWNYAANAAARKAESALGDSND